MLTDNISKWLMRTVPHTGFHYQSNMPIAIASNIGLVRKNNQDRIAILKVDANSPTIPPFVAVALADGMGGMNNGAECAALTIGAFFNALIRHRQSQPEERLKLAALEANRLVHEYSNGDGGATLSALVFDSTHGAWSVNVGDSRIYATQPEGSVARLTVDDSLEEAVGGHGKDLLQFIGMGQGLIPHTSQTPSETKKIVITSDGVHFIDHAVLSDILIKCPSEDDTVKQLISMSQWRGGPDNASAASISMPELLDFLKFREPGIEISDPFGTLQIIWVKPGHKDPIQNPSEYRDPVEESTTVPSPPVNPTPQKNESTRAKTPKKRSSRKKSNQLEFSVEPTIDLPSKES
jgi:serine/threonine protein phosphatase PrpC